MATKTKASLKLSRLALCGAVYMRLLIILLVLLTGCLSESGRKGLPMIDDISIGSQDSGEEEEENLAEIRPDGQVYVNNNFCSCINRKADILNQCDSFCSTAQNTASPTLYGSVTLGSDILNNTKFKTLYGWCRAQLIGEDGNLITSPECRLRIKDDWGNEKDLTISIKANSNSFTVNLTGDTVIGERYMANIVETTSGAKSTPFQFQRINPASSTSYSNIPIKTLQLLSKILKK